MIIKPLRELHCVDTISQDKGWKKIHEALGELTEDICIDFADINVIEPWQCLEFKKLLREEHVHMQFVNNEEVVNRIKMMCIIDGLDENRIKNIVVELPKEKTSEEKRIERVGLELIPYFDIVDGVATFELEKRYSQIQSTNTLGYIDYAIREIHKTQEINEFVIKLGELKTLPNVLQVIASMMVTYEQEGFHLLLDSNDEEVINNMGLFIHRCTSKNYSASERKKIIQNNIRVNTAGILVKYKKSKALDEFGREGKGEIVSSRIAIFRGFENDKNNKELCVKVETFNNNYFYTKEHWMIEHDYEEPTSLHNETILIPFNQLGVGNVFLGSKYHFLLPIQQEKEENKTVIVGIDDEGHNIKKNCTIPERMECVFKSWGVHYNEEELKRAITETNRVLNETKNTELDNLEGVKFHNAENTGINI